MEWLFETNLLITSYIPLCSSMHTISKKSILVFKESLTYGSKSPKKTPKNSRPLNMIEYFKRCSSLTMFNVYFMSLIMKNLRYIAPAPRANIYHVIVQSYHLLLYCFIGVILLVLFFWCYFIVFILLVLFY